jgi:hypothetical protein
MQVGPQQEELSLDKLASFRPLAEQADTAVAVSGKTSDLFTW